MTLSEKLDEIVRNVNEKIEITFLATEDDLESNIGSEAVYIQQQVAKMAEANRNITVKYVDLEKNPSYIKDYAESDNLTDNSVIVKSDRRYRVLSIFNGILQSSTDSSTGSTTWTNNSEMVFASAIKAVTSEKLPVVAFATGNGEQDGESLQTYLNNNNFECSTVDLLSVSEIPDNIDVLVLHAMSADLTKVQVDMLDKFLQNGSNLGKSLLVTFLPSQTTMPNLNAFLNDWGINVIEGGGYVVESDSSRYAALPILPFLQKNTEEGTYLESLANNNNYILGYAPVPIEVLSDSKYGLQVETLVSTYDSAYMMPSDADENYKPEESDYKSYPVLTNSQTGSSINGEYRTSNVMVCASGLMLDPSMGNGQIASILSQQNLLNKEILMTWLRYNTGTTDDENTVYIEPAQVSTLNMTVTSAQITGYGLWVFTITIPILILIVGIVVWSRRRHL